MEPFKICATADVHLGMKFASYPAVQAELSEVRYGALETVVRRSNSEGCALLVIAGDLFNTAKVPEKNIQKTADILAQFEGNCILLLPGNHDYYSGDGSALWRNLKSLNLDRAVFLTEKKQYPLDHFDLPVTVYAAPCDSHYSGENAVKWIDPVKKESDRFYIGTAHGSIEKISPDLTRRYFPMSQKELEEKNLDLWIIGHTHIPFPAEQTAGSSIFIPGSPEPDGFDCRHEGFSWIIEIGAEKQISAHRFRTGTYRFLHAPREVRSAEDVEQLTEDLLALPEPDRTLLKINLTGSLPKSDFPLIQRAAGRLTESFLHLEMEDDELAREISRDEIRNEFRENSFPFILLSRLAESGEKDALRTAYELLQESRK